MEIIVVSNFCSQFSDYKYGRFLYLCYLLSVDNHVELLVSDFNHSKKEKIDYIQSQLPFDIRLISEPGYKKNISIQRIASHIVWGFNIRKYLKNKRVDVVYCAVPTLFAAYEVSKFCKRTGSRFVIDIQDLWPEAFYMARKKSILTDLLFSPIRFIADLVYRSADEVCAVSQTYLDRALQANNTIQEGHVAYIGIDLESFDKYVAENPVVRTDKELWLGYCGSMGDSYDLICVIDALSIMENRPLLMAMGDGEKRKKFEEHAKLKGIKAVFTGKLPYEQMCGRLAACDIAVNPIAGQSAASIINKHGDYAAAGLPVINTQGSKEYRDLVEKYQMGINCINGDINDLAKAIKQLCDDQELRKKMGKQARRCAEEKFDKAHTYKTLLEATKKQ